MQHRADFDMPMQARSSADSRETGELRQETPRWVLDVLDALSMADQGCRTRADYVNKVLEGHVRAELTRVSLIKSVAGRNPIVSELVGGQHP